MVPLIFSFRLLVLVLYVYIGYVSSTDCPDRFVAFEGSCYLFGHSELVNFVTAENYCRQHGSHLVWPESTRQIMFLKDYISTLTSKQFWLGITDENTEGIWQYYGTSRDLNVTDWGPGNPDSYKGTDEDCGAIWFSDGKWTDLGCATFTIEPLCQLK